MTTHADILTKNRAKFTKNRVVYVSPNGIHTVYDIEEDNLNELITLLAKDNFTSTITHTRDDYHTTDWFKHGDDGWWESYVITTR